MIAFAEGAEGASTVRNALTTSLTSVGNDLTGVITDVLPIALGIVGAVMVIVFGVKIFKKLTGKA